MQKTVIILPSRGAPTVGGDQSSVLYIPWERDVPTRSASDRTTSRPPISTKQLWLWEVGQSSSPQWKEFCNVSPEWSQTSARNGEECYSFPNTPQKKVLISPEIFVIFCRNKNLLYGALATKSKGCLSASAPDRSCNHLTFSLPHTAHISFPADCELQGNEASLPHRLNTNGEHTLSLTELPNKSWEKTGW